jgi:hypothetical protein
MAYEKSKIEKYNNAGGINEKVSRYITDSNQFLDIRNFGFERPGALTSRPGIADFASLSSATYLTNPRGIFQYTKDDGTSLVVFDVGNRLYNLAGPSAIATTLSANATTGLDIDFAVGGNVLYYSNGYTFQRFDASYSALYNIPEQRVFIIGAGLTFNLSLISGGDTQILAAGKYEFKYAYKKGIGGVSGIIGERAEDDLDVGINVPFLSVSLTATLVVTTGQWLVYGITVTNGYGISSVVPYMDLPSVGTSFIAGPSAVPFFATTYGGITLYTLEIYKNMLFMAGFSSLPSTIYHSNLGDFERLEQENFFEVRTGNSDSIRCMIVYQDTIVAFKNKSIHEIKGDSPETLSLKDVTLEYGCVNNTAAVQFKNKLWFMDAKGICEYNGPDTFIVSYAIEDKLNAVDKSTCRAFHVKKRNEVWFCCGDKTFVYDYDVNAWTIYDGIPIENDKAAGILEFTDGSIDLVYAQTGTSFINFSRFGDTLSTDRGADITLIAKTMFHKIDGETTQDMWRRFYFDAGASTAGSTFGVTLNLRQDYGESIVAVKSLVSSEFQERIDFGVSAKTLSVEWIIKSSQRITVNGYTLEGRFLRST